MYTTHHFKTLTEMVVRHGYFLDDGTTLFDALTPQEKKDTMLSRYQLEDVLELVPVARSAKELKALRMMVQKTSQGFKLIMRVNDENKPVIAPSASTTFVFALKVRHPLFPYFTDCKLDPKRIYLFANNMPNEVWGEMDFMPMVATPDSYVKDIYLLNEADSTRMLDKWTKPEERFGMIGLVWLSIEGHDTANNLLTTEGKVRVSPNSYKAHFKTQSTIWKYKMESVDFTAKTTVKKPLTKYGYIPIVATDDLTPTILPGSDESKYSYPNPLLETFEKDGSDLCSVIFI